jgi:hypothetical protein
VALVELRRLRVLGAAAQVESLRVFHDVIELTLRRPLKPAEIRGVVGAVRFQVEFMSGREFGLRTRGEGLVLLNRARELLEMLGAVMTGADGEAGRVAMPAPRGTA